VMGKLIAMVVIIVVSTLALTFLDAKISEDSIKGELWLGVLMGIGNMVPVFGVWIGIALAAIITLAQVLPDFWFMSLFVIGIGLVLQVIDEFIITPTVVGKAIDLKPLVVMAVVYVGGWLMGISGMILAVPVAAIIKIGYEIFLKKKPDVMESDDGGNDGG
ncbi:MAG: AI-2E family transporter, partial [Eubacteriales bacterium]